LPAMVPVRASGGPEPRHGGRAQRKRHEHPGEGRGSWKLRARGSTRCAARGPRFLFLKVYYYQYVIEYFYLIYQIVLLRSRNALPITLTELNDIAAAANAGVSSKPVSGYRTPAASGTPSAL